MLDLIFIIYEVGFKDSQPGKVAKSIISHKILEKLTHTLSPSLSLKGETYIKAASVYGLLVWLHASLIT